MDFFSTSPGIVAVLEGQGLPTRVGLSNFRQAPAMRALLVSLGGAERGHFQFNHSLREFLWVYVFGDKMGELRLGGIALGAVCGVAGVRTGIEQVLSYYRRFRLSVTGLPVVVTLGMLRTFRAFLTGFDFNYNDTSAGLASFTMHLNYPGGKGTEEPLIPLPGEPAGSVTGTGGTDTDGGATEDIGPSVTGTAEGFFEGSATGSNGFIGGSDLLGGGAFPDLNVSIIL